ncbi:hypothetical protein CTAYLR_009374 [Chrysophaeum taylorii]|uniref:Inositol polyphosphate-related phosphatase domain-containing protein n=1 Tax=Chrysophaeum taylorii TaxID=2483200 RepID=A0AAD7XMF9_9STRA|nr:hypothetical protein CTAYLR_009374 [Chrysophaeum taylorii]
MEGSIEPQGGLAGKTSEELRRDIEERREILVRCVTWNLQAKPTACSAAIRKRLLPLESYHMLHVGTQECERSIALSLINQSKAKWTATLREAVGPNYEPLVSHTLQATHSILFVHRGVLPLVRGMRSAAVATGVGAGETRLGNKGGIGLALHVGAVKIVFVTAHLAAHQKNVSTRNREVSKISSDLTKLLRESAVNRVVSTRDDEPTQTTTTTTTLEGAVSNDDAGGPNHVGDTSGALLDVFDCVFWSGDLNYRVEMSRAAADSALASGDLAALREADQLRVAISEGNALSRFSEGPLEFFPTYKFDSVDATGDARAAAGDVYDSSAKQRVPSWTDRVLWASRDEEVVELLEYTSVPDLRSSDHRPVFATFKIKLQTGSGALIDARANDGAAQIENMHQSQVCSLQ